MSVFGDYANYYNLLYSDKDTAGEVLYVDRLIKKYAPQAETILNLGCGTGRHDLLLAKQGYQTSGVDLSSEMLAVAKQQAQVDDNKRSCFFQGDARNYRAEKTFDVVISLFHVLSYQISDSDVKALLATANAHLSSGGVFIFDFWYAPAVLNEQPEERTKQLESEHFKITRHAKPVHFPQQNVIDVNYELIVLDKTSGKTQTIKEKHPMRYFFFDEILQALKSSGFKLLNAEEWMSAKPLSETTWGSCFCAAKV